MFFALLTLLNIATTPIHSFAHEARFACARKVKNPLLQSFINEARHTIIRRIASRLEANSLGMLTELPSLAPALLQTPRHHQPLQPWLGIIAARAPVEKRDPEPTPAIAALTSQSKLQIKPV